VKDSGVGQAVKALGTPIAPPASADEQVVHSHAGAPGLEIYRAAKGIVAAAGGMIKSEVDKYPQAVRDFQRGVQDFQNKDWSNLPSDAVSTGADVAGAVSPQMSGPAQGVRELSEGARPGGNLATPLTRQAVDAGTALVGAKLGAGEASPAEASAAKSPGIVQQVVKGEGVAQKPAQAALSNPFRNPNPWATARAAANQSLRTTLDAPIQKIGMARQAAYNLVDQSAGTDVKALYDKLENTEYNIRQLTDTEEDVAKEASLEKARTATMDKISDARQQVIAKLGPKNGAEAFDKADQLFKQEQALKDLQTKVFKNPSVVKGNTASGTPETVDVDSAVSTLQKMQDNTKFGGPRLEQALGKDNAKGLLDDLYAAQRVGQKAMPKAKLARWLVGLAVGGGVAGGAYDLIK